MTAHTCCAYLGQLHWRPNYGINNNLHTATTHTLILRRARSLSWCYRGRFDSQTACLCTIHWGDLWIFYQNWPNCLTIHVACPVVNGGREERACHDCHKNNRQRRQRSSSSDTLLHPVCFYRLYLPTGCHTEGAGGRGFKWKETMWLAPYWAITIIKWI